MNIQGVAAPYISKSNTWAKRQNGETTFKSAKSAEIKNTALSKAKKAAAGIGVLGAAAGIIYLAVSGKGKKALDAVKKYFNKNADNAKDLVEDTFETAKSHKIFEQGVGKNKKIVENVKLENGRAFFEDGSGFTGVMKTVNKKGDNIQIEYYEGEMLSSIINDSVRKNYETLTNLQNITVNGQTKTVPVKTSRVVNNIRSGLLTDSSFTEFRDGKPVFVSGKAGRKILSYDENGKFIGMENLK